jgi:uncharacterized protein (DUF433 family)
MVLPDFLTQLPDGEITLTGHRIGLYHIVHYYQEGFSAEMLACQYPTLPLALIHKTIGFYLENQTETDVYMKNCREAMQQLANARHVDISALRHRLSTTHRAGM